MTVTLTASDRSEARLRSVIQPPGPLPPGTPPPHGPTAVDIETRPGAGLAFAWPDTELTLEYAANIAKIDVALDPPVLLLNNGRAAAAWWTQTLRLTLAEEASYGHTSYLGLAPAAQLGPAPTPGGVPTITYVPPASDVTIGSLRTIASATWRIDARWNSSASAYYEVAGGIDDISQLSVPRRHGPGGDVTATYALEPTDDLATRVAASDTRVSATGGEFFTVAATETLTHRWSEATQGSVGAGLTFLRSRASALFTFGYSVLPNGTASLSHTIPLESRSTLTLTTSTGLGTGYNSAAGLVQYSASALGAATWTRDPFGVTATVSGGQSIRVRDVDPPVSRALTGSLVASYRPVELIVFEIGARTSWQFSEDPRIGSYPAQWVLFAAISLHAPPLRF